MRVGLVGCGLMGRRRANAICSSDLDELVIVADTSHALAESLCVSGRTVATSDWREVVSRSDIQSVVISTSNEWLAPITIAALENGKHVLCEKPLGRSEAEARLMVKVARANRRRLKAGFNHRHHPGIARAHEVLIRGLMGPPLLLRCRYGHGGRPGYEKDWRLNRDISGGGEMLDQGIHVADLARWFLGDFAQVFGFAESYFWNSAGGERVATVEDNAFALFRTIEGRIASVHVSWTQWRNLFSLEVVGRDGYVTVDGLGGSYGPEVVKVGRRKAVGGVPEEEILEFPGPDVSLQAEWREFTTAIREDREPLGNGYDGWQAIRLVDAVYASAQSGWPVTITSGSVIEEDEKIATTVGTK